MAVILGILPTITRIRSVLCAFAKPLAIGLILAISACASKTGGIISADSNVADNRIISDGDMTTDDDDDDGGDMTTDDDDDGSGMMPPDMTVPLPTPSSDRTLADLNAYDTPTNLAADEIRAGLDSSSVGDITGFRYDDADGNLQVLVEKLDFAHLGIWITGDIADNDFAYANLADNAVTLAADFSGFSTASYIVEGDMTYKEIRLYPGMSAHLNFAAGTFSGSFVINGASLADNFGDANAMVPDGSGGMRPVTSTDLLGADFSGTEITADGFNGNMRITDATGFFADIPTTTFTDAVNGRFHHGGDYVMGTTIPNEISGTIDGIMDSNGMELKGGFLGQCTTNC